MPLHSWVFICNWIFLKLQLWADKVLGKVQYWKILWEGKCFVLRDSDFMCSAPWHAQIYHILKYFMIELMFRILRVRFNNDCRVAGLTGAFVGQSVGLFRIKFSTYCTLPIERGVQGHKRRLCLYSGIVCFGGYSSEMLGYIKTCLYPSISCSVKE